MTARLQIEIQRRPTSLLACLLQRKNFGVLQCLIRMGTFSDHRTGRINNHRADARIR